MKKRTRLKKAKSVVFLLPAVVVAALIAVLLPITAPQLKDIPERLQFSPVVAEAAEAAPGKTNAIARKNVIRVRPVQESRTIDTETFEEPSSYKDGVYVGQAQGFGGPITVQVTISGGKITGVNVSVSEDESEYPEDNAPFLQYATSGRTRQGIFLPGIPAQVVERQQADNVDVVSGATYSSNALITAIRQALLQAVCSAEDTVSGATFSSSGLICAAEEALSGCRNQ